MIALIGCLEILTRGFVNSFPQTCIVALLAGAVWLIRRAPAVSLALIWIAAGVHLLLFVPPMLIEFLAIPVLAFGMARYGSTAVLWLSGLSIPAVILVAGMFGVVYARVRYFSDSGYGVSLSSFASITPVLLSLLVLVVPWLVGLTMRIKADSATRETAAREGQVRAEAQQQQAEVERSQAQQIADLREGQARLARDVHDVVGHSLAVILAQAESAQFLADDDSAAMRDVLTNVATSARQSLQDVRNVLSTTGEPWPTNAPSTMTREFEGLIEGVRAAGHQVNVTTVGTPQPLPPELATVALRVLQEMLTNAIKHGDRTQPCLLEQHWEGELRLEVSNHCALTSGVEQSETQPISAAGEPSPTAEENSQGLGVPGMRDRLESIGGRLDVRRRQAPSGSTYTATAWIPLRSEAVR